MGGVELLISLHNDSRFEGHCGPLTMAFCRILEDENTLQGAMETEIMSTLIKLHKKQDNGSQIKPSVPTADFLQCMTPLIHREPSGLVDTRRTQSSLSYINFFQTFLNTLPPAIVAEAQLLRERADSRVANITGGFIAETMN